MTSSVWILCVCMIGVHAAICVHVRNPRSYPPRVNVRENDTVLLPCYVEDQDVEQTKIKWWRGETLLADIFEPNSPALERFIVHSNNSLQILHVQREDGGKYICQVIRPLPLGHVTQAHEIVVMYPPSAEMVPASGELEVNLEEDVDMQCVTKGEPAPIISWRTKGEEIQLLSVRDHLRFQADNRNLSGRYTCVVTNIFGNATAHINLHIKHKPEVYVNETTVYAYPGKRVKLDCTVIAWPEAKVEWYFKNETLKYTPRMMTSNIGNNHSLTIRNVKTSDYGSYTCRASNSLGITENMIAVTGTANPAVFKKEWSSVSSTSYNFIWEVDSYNPIIEYQLWFRKYKNDGTGGKWHKLHIPSGSTTGSSMHTYTFNLTGLDAATHYEAVVMSRNRYGWSHPSEILLFRTEEALELNRVFETDGNQNQSVQLASISQRPFVTDANGSMRIQAQVLALILNILIIKYFE